MGMIEDFQKAGAERRADMAALRQQVADMRSEIANTLRDLSRQSAAYRHSETARLQATVANMMKDFTTQTQERKAEVATIAGETATIIKEANHFVRELVRGSAQRASEVNEVLKDLRTQTQERRAEIASIARQAAAIHTLVWGTAPVTKRAAPVTAEWPGEAAGDKSAAEAAPPGELRDRVFAYLANHPDGSRLTKLEEEFGAARIQIAKLVRELIDDNKVEKRDLLYFAI